MKISTLAVSALALMLAPKAAAQTCELAVDLNQTGGALSSDPSSGTSASAAFVELGGVHYFLASTAATGEELWRTDGTSAGTALVKDVRPGEESSAITWLTAYAGRLWFVAEDGLTGPELHTSDGTAAGTYLVSNIKVGPSGPDLAWLTGMGGKLYFTANDGHVGSELWVSDGTALGTHVVADIVPGIGGANIGPIATAAGGQQLLFQADDGAAGSELWISDGTAAGTQLLADIQAGPSSSGPDQFLAAMGRTWFVADDGVHGRELWSTDGTAAGTAMVADIDLAPTGSQVELSETAVLGGALYFRATGSNGSELWRTDGTAAGTVEVADVAPFGSSNPSDMTPFNGRVYFSAADGSFVGRELWSTDGSAAGTSLVYDFGATIDGLLSSNNELTVVGNELFLVARSADWSDRELWKTDGSVVVQVIDLIVGTEGSAPSGLTALSGGGLLFAAEGPGVGRELWLTDGTALGTGLLADLEPGTVPISSSPDGIHLVGDEYLLFAADDGVHGTELWRWDATSGATMLGDQYPGSIGSSPVILTTAWLNGKLLTFFMASQGPAGFKLYTTDGTLAGNTELDFDPLGSSTSSQFFFHPPTQRVYFRASTPGFGWEPWVTDGTLAGTTLLLDVDPGVGHGIIGGFEAVGDKVLFSGRDPQGGFEPWITDGTPAGTHILLDVNPTAGGVTNSFMRVDQRVVFTADDGVHGKELWVTDGTAAGTSMIVDLVPGSGSPNLGLQYAHEGVLYFSANDGVIGSELWKTDLTAAGTVLVKDLFPGSPAFSGSPKDFVAAGDGNLYFTARLAPGLGRILWRTDGTTAGTQPVDTTLISPSELKPLSNGVAFSAFGDQGQELYTTDGTAAGTQLACDLMPGPLNGGPKQLVYFDGALYFSAYAPSTGRELYRLVQPGAHVLDLGPENTAARLTAADPVLGSNMQISCRGWMQGTVGLLVMSGPVAPSASPLVESASVAWIDPFGVTIQGIMTGLPWQTQKPVPSTPSLVGGRLNLQVWFLPGGGFPAVTSNALQLVLGN